MTDTLFLNYKEKYQLLWEKFNRRSENDSKIIKTIDGAALAAFLAIFSIGQLKDITPIIGIFILFIWRWCAHCIDEEIISLYERMIICENKLGIKDEKLSLKNVLKNLLNGVWYKRCLNRNHGFFDILAFSLMIILAYYSNQFNLFLFSIVPSIFFGIVFIILNYSAIKNIEKIVYEN